MLRAVGLAKAYGGRHVVDGVDLDIAKGRVVGLVGPNGAGKTTTIKMLVGLVEPTRGTAELGGSRTTRPETRRALGYLPEESPLYDEQTAHQYLAFFASLYGVAKGEARTRADAILDRLALDAKERDKPLGTMSKGMRRKVAIARCLVHDPDVLVLDEPTSGLDPFTAAELDAFIRELRDRGKAIFLSAHNLRQVEELCDEIVIMHGGRVRARGSLAELRGAWATARYRVHATAPFPGSVPHGTAHQAELATLDAVERAFGAIRAAGGEVIEVESVLPGLDEILRRTAGTDAPAVRQVEA